MQYCRTIAPSVNVCSLEICFLEGLPHLEVWTDHKPLKAMYKLDLKEVTNTHIHNFREKTAHLNFTVKWTAGKSHLIADKLSQANVPATFEDGEPIIQNTEHLVMLCVKKQNNKTHLTQ